MNKFKRYFADHEWAQFTSWLLITFIITGLFIFGLYSLISFAKENETMQYTEAIKALPQTKIIVIDVESGAVLCEETGRIVVNTEEMSDAVNVIIYDNNNLKTQLLFRSSDVIVKTTEIGG